MYVGHYLLMFSYPCKCHECYLAQFNGGARGWHTEFFRAVPIESFDLYPISKLAAEQDFLKHDCNQVKCPLCQVRSHMEEVIYDSIGAYVDVHVMEVWFERLLYRFRTDRKERRVPEIPQFLKEYQPPENVWEYRLYGCRPDSFIDLSMMHFDPEEDLMVTLEGIDTEPARAFNIGRRFIEDWVARMDIFPELDVVGFDLMESWKVHSYDLRQLHSTVPKRLWGSPEWVI